MVIGDAPVSTDDQNPDLQRAALTAARCEAIDGAQGMSRAAHGDGRNGHADAPAPGRDGG